MLTEIAEGPRARTAAACTERQRRHVISFRVPLLSPSSQPWCAPPFRGRGCRPDNYLQSSLNGKLEPGHIVKFEHLGGRKMREHRHKYKPNVGSATWSARDPQSIAKLKRLVDKSATDWVQQLDVPFYQWLAYLQQQVRSISHSGISHSLAVRWPPRRPTEPRPSPTCLVPSDRHGRHVPVRLLLASAWP